MKSLLFTNIQLQSKSPIFVFVWLWNVSFLPRRKKHNLCESNTVLRCSEYTFNGSHSDNWKIEIFTISASFPAETWASFSGHHYRGSGFTDALPAYGFWKGGCRAWGQRRIGRMGWDGATMGGMHKEAVSSRYLMFREVSQARKQPIYKHICGPIWQIKYIFTWSIFHCWKGSMVLASLPMVGCSLKFLLALVGRAGDVLQVLMSSAPPRRSTAFLGGLQLPGDFTRNRSKPIHTRWRFKLTFWGKSGILKEIPGIQVGHSWHEFHWNFLHVINVTKCLEFSKASIFQANFAGLVIDILLGPKSTPAFSESKKADIDDETYLLKGIYTYSWT